MIELYLYETFRLLDLVLILAISNLVTEQKIMRDVVLRIFNVENYINFGRVKRFIFNGLSCNTCFSVWVSFIYLLFNNILFDKGHDIKSYIVIPLVVLLSASILNKK